MVKPWNNINLNFQSSAVKHNSNENKLWTNLIHHIKLQAQTVLHSITVSSKCMKLVAIIWEIFHPKLNLLDKNTSESWQELLDTPFCYERLVQARNQRGRRGGLPCPFLKIGKKCPNFGKNALIVVILGYISHSKCGFKSCQKKFFFSPDRAFLLCIIDDKFIKMRRFQENSPVLKNSQFCCCMHCQVYQQTKFPLNFPELL